MTESAGDGFAKYMIEHGVAGDQKTEVNKATGLPITRDTYCPVCGSKVVLRERSPNGSSTCAKGHRFLSSKALKFATSLGLTPKEPVVEHHTIKAPEMPSFDHRLGPVITELVYEGVDIVTWLSIQASNVEHEGHVAQGKGEAALAHVKLHKAVRLREAATLIENLRKDTANAEAMRDSAMKANQELIDILHAPPRVTVRADDKMIEELKKWKPQLAIMEQPDTKATSSSHIVCRRCGTRRDPNNIFSWCSTTLTMDYAKPIGSQLNGKPHDWSDNDALQTTAAPVQPTFNMRYLRKLAVPPVYTTNNHSVHSPGFGHSSVEAVAVQVDPQFPTGYIMPWAGEGDVPYGWEDVTEQVTKWLAGRVLP